MFNCVAGKCVGVAQDGRQPFRAEQLGEHLRPSEAHDSDELGSLGKQDRGDVLTQDGEGIRPGPSSGFERPLCGDRPCAVSTVRCWPD